MAEYISFRGGRPALVALIRRAVAGVSTPGSGRPDLAEMALLPAAVVLLSKIQQAYIVKARGGTDEAGIKWAPLKRETVARRPIGPGDLAAIGARGTKVPADRTRGLLTPAQDKRWRSIFGSRLAHFRAQGMPDSEAKARAAQIAWATVKREGAKTKLEVLGGRQVEIGRDKGMLLRSLTPGVRSAEQIQAVEPGRITVGSNCPYAKHFHARRPLWPTGDPATLPASWNEAVGTAIARGLLRVLVLSIQSPPG